MRHPRPCKAFIHRYQERLPSPTESSVSTGTETCTRISHEKPDPDAPVGSVEAIPRGGSPRENGTATHTFVRTEAADSDAAISNFQTQTMTATQESLDRDPRIASCAAIPRA